jgi:hypothetical protein
MLLDLFPKEIGFENIHGYDDIKDIVKRVLDAEDNYNLLFIGPPARQKYLELAMKSPGYQDHCNPDLDAYICRHTLKSSF